MLSPNFVMTSPAFEAHGEMPSTFTCEGKNESPPLFWSGAPKGTVSFALVVDDPDAPDPRAPRTVFVHWVVFNIPADVSTLAQNASQVEMPFEAIQGLNDWHERSYGGPCPPTGEHRYFFKLYALDTTLTKLKNPTKAALEQAMYGHILGRAELVGVYQKASQKNQASAHRTA